MVVSKNTGIDSEISRQNFPVQYVSPNTQNDATCSPRTTFYLSYAAITCQLRYLTTHRASRLALCASTSSSSDTLSDQKNKTHAREREERLCFYYLSCSKKKRDRSTSELVTGGAKMGSYRGLFAGFFHGRLYHYYHA